MEDRQDGIETAIDALSRSGPVDVTYDRLLYLSALAAEHALRLRPSPDMARVVGELQVLMAEAP